MITVRGTEVRKSIGYQQLQQSRPAKWTGPCRWCRKSIEFVRHRDTLKIAPLNLDYDDDGNIFVEGDTYIVLVGEVRLKALARGVKLRVNHNVTCSRTSQREHEENETN